MSPTSFRIEFAKRIKGRQKERARSQKENAKRTLAIAQIAFANEFICLAIIRVTKTPQLRNLVSKSAIKRTRIAIVSGLDSLSVTWLDPTP